MNQLSPRAASVVPCKPGASASRAPADGSTAPARSKGFASRTIAGAHAARSQAPARPAASLRRRPSAAANDGYRASRDSSASLASARSREESATPASGQSTRRTAAPRACPATSTMSASSGNVVGGAVHPEGRARDERASGRVATRGGRGRVNRARASSRGGRCPCEGSGPASHPCIRRIRSARCCPIGRRRSPCP